MWTAELSLAGDSAIPDSGTLEIGDLKLTGTTYRTLPFAGTRKILVIGGANGWSKVIESQNYTNPAGIPLSVVLGDAADACGEKVSIASDVTIGLSYERERAPASRVLRNFAADGWWMRDDGVTVIGPRARAGEAITSKFQITSYDGAQGMAAVATEKLSDWLPGRTYAAPTLTTEQTIAMTSVVVEGEGKLRIGVVSRSSVANRLLLGFRGLMRDAFPRLSYLGLFEYAVQSSDGDVAELSIVDSTQPISDLVAVKIRGMKVKPAVGGLCLVAFVNGDPTRPAIVSVDPLSRHVELDASETMDLGKTCPLTTIANGTPVLQAAARANDPVQAGPFSGIILLGSPGVAIGNGV